MRTKELLVLLFASLAILKNTNGETLILMKDENGYSDLVDLDLENQLPEPRLEPIEVIFYYYSQVSQQPIKLQLGQALDALNDSDFVPDRTTYVIVHGWHNDNTSSLNQLVGTAILDKCNDCNLIVTDWRKAASGLYTIARISVPVVGQAVASLVTELNLKSDLLTIIGHSLGAHASGIASDIITDKLGLPSQIIGLDPALPLFELTSEAGRLDPSDAKLVHIIHTCAGFLGFLDPIGHVDYYPGQGGEAQPGCELDPFCTCAHGRSYKYYAESVRNGGFTATSCDTYDNYLHGTCDSNPRSHMGGLHLDTMANGTYYIHVNNQEPFSLG